MIYNKQDRKSVPIIGKHTKKITFSCWSANNELALAAEDKQVGVLAVFAVFVLVCDRVTYSDANAVGRMYRFQ